MIKKIMDFIRYAAVSVASGIYFCYKGVFGNRAGCAVIYYPAFYDRGELLHHYYAVRYFLQTDGDSRKIFFFISEELKEVLSTLKKLPPPDYLGDCPWGEGENVILNVSKRRINLFTLILRYRPSKVLLWSNTKPSRIMSLVLACGLVVNVDRFTTWGCYSYAGLRPDFVGRDALTKRRNAVHRKFLDYVKSLPVFSKAYVFGTGPSIATAFDYDFSDGYRIVCNTMIKNKELMAHIRPHFMVAGDAIYHFGISRYAWQFRKDLEQFLSDHQCLFLIPEQFFANFMVHHPDLAQYTLPVPYTAERINLSMKEKFEIKAVHNILNQLLLPLASSLCDAVFLLGFDGRKSTDRQFWKSIESVNYEDLKEYHQAAHPGFFSGINYEEYAETQSELAEMIMSQGESMGKKYYCLNDSANKAMKKRYLNDFSQNQKSTVAEYHL